MTNPASPGGQRPDAAPPELTPEQRVALRDCIVGALQEAARFGGSAHNDPSLFAALVIARLGSMK